MAEKYVKPFAGKVPDSMAHYYGMLVNFDENLARLRRELRQLGLEENTILIFLSDNGTADGVELDKHGYPTAGFNAGMKGDKLSEYEGGHRVPCLVYWPAGGIRGGREVIPADGPHSTCCLPSSISADSARRPTGSSTG